METGPDKGEKIVITGIDKEMEAVPFRTRAKRLAVKTAIDWNNLNVGTYASSIAFFFFMSIIPLAILLLHLLPYAGLSQYELFDFAQDLLPEALQRLVATVITEAYMKSGGVMSVSALVLFWAASRGTMALRWGLNLVYDEKEQRSYPVLCLLAIGYTIALLIIFSIMLFLIFAGPVSNYLTITMPQVFGNPVTIELRQKIYLHVLMVLAFTLVYTFIPAGRRKIHRQIPGAVIVAVLWEVFSYFFSIYVRSYNTYTKFYGSLGAIAILLLWLYCCFYIMLIGGYFNRFCGIRWERLKKMVFRRKPGS